MNPIKDILFDLEGVVVDSEPIWDETDHELFRRHGATGYDGVHIKPLVMGRTVLEAMRIIQSEYDIPGNVHELMAERKDIFEEMIRRDLKFIPGFQEFFAAVKGRYRVAAATSAERRFLKAFEDKLQLQNYFGEHIYSIEDIGFVAKPNPDIYLHAAKSLGAEPAATVVFEDAPLGVQGAKAAGMRCVALTTSTTRERLAAAGADAVVDAYSDIELTKPNLVRPESFSS
jgi:HAD superfamily hydrolase (TIGR01509 family)